MTPDELITRVHRQRTEQIAIDLAMDALMAALPPELQQKWLQALQTLQSTRTASLQSHGMDALGIAQANEAIDRRKVRLKAQMGTQGTT